MYMFAGYVSVCHLRGVCLVEVFAHDTCAFVWRGDCETHGLSICSPVTYNLSNMTGFVCGKCGERVCSFLCVCVSVRLYVFMCMWMSLCVCARVCVCDSVRVCACVTVCSVSVLVCFVKSWRPGLRSMCVCVCGNVKPCRLESTPESKRERTPTRGHTRLNPPPPRATRA